VQPAGASVITMIQERERERERERATWYQERPSCIAIVLQGLATILIKLLWLAMHAALIQ
jgi:hypothetical protein